MPQNKRKDIARRRNQVADLNLQGLKNFEIAEILKVSPSQICLDLKAISKEWRDQRVSDIDEVKSRELSKLDLIEKKAFAEYERSKEAKTKKSMKKRGVSVKDEKDNKTKILGNDSEQTFTEEQQLGDPRYMTIILECISKRAKIIGYEAAQKVSLGFSDMSDQQLNTYQSALLELKNKSNG